MNSLALPADRRASAAARGRRLEIFTVIWAALEAAIALFAAQKDGSISLTGFGFDSLIEVVSAVALLWRMSHEMDHHPRHHAELVSLRVAGGCLVALGAYVLLRASEDLYHHNVAHTGWLGIGVTAAAIVAMPLLSRAKRQVGEVLASSAMMTDAKQPDFCMYQAVIVLFGLLMHTFFRISWADSAAALLLVPFLIRAGVASLQGKSGCHHH